MHATKDSFKIIFILGILAALAASESTCSYAQTILNLPQEEMPAYQLVDLFNTLDHEYLGFDQVYSFRDTQHTYLEQKHYRYETKIEDLVFFKGTQEQFLQQTIDDMDKDLFQGVNVEYKLWQVKFNKEYEPNSQIKTLTTFELPATPIAGKTMYTAFFLPTTSDLVSVNEGEMMLFDEKGGVIGVTTNHNQSVSVLIDGELRSDLIKHVTFIQKDPPPLPPPLPEPQVLSPTPEVVEPEGLNLPIVPVAIGLILIIGGGAAALFFIKKKQQKELIEQYSGPRSHVEVAPQHKVHHLPDAVKHLGNILHLKKKRKS